MTYLYSGQTKTVSVYGNLCLTPCDTNDKKHYCSVAGGDTELCGPGPNTTPQGDPCSDQCRKRGDGYYWCQTGQDTPWDYCSPPLVFQQRLTCPPDAERMTVGDPSSCARYLSCEAGQVKLEECPDGLHYIQRNRTCEWPVSDNQGQCEDVFSRFNSYSSPSPSSTSAASSQDRSPPLTLARTDPILDIPADYFDNNDDDIAVSTNKRVVFPTEDSDTNSATPEPNNNSPTNRPNILTTSTEFITNTNRSYPRSLFTENTFSQDNNSKLQTKKFQN